MKPFNLEAAMRGEPLCYRDGSPAKFIAYVPEATKSQQLITMTADGSVLGASARGNVYGQDVGHNNYDVFMQDLEVIKFVNFNAVTGFGMLREDADSAIYSGDPGSYKPATHVYKLTLLDGKITAFEIVHTY